jgi:hypothetical protein
VRAICSLEAAPEQCAFVAPNDVSMPTFKPNHWMRAIYADGRPVGALWRASDRRFGSVPQQSLVHRASPNAAGR